MNTGVVTTYLNNLIARQVEFHQLVVWYDPEAVSGSPTPSTPEAGSSKT